MEISPTAIHHFPSFLRCSHYSEDFLDACWQSFFFPFYKCDFDDLSGVEVEKETEKNNFSLNFPIFKMHFSSLERIKLFFRHYPSKLRECGLREILSCATFPLFSSTQIPNFSWCRNTKGKSTNKRYLQFNELNFSQMKITSSLAVKLCFCFPNLSRIIHSTNIVYLVSFFICLIFMEILGKFLYLCKNKKLICRKDFS